MSETFIQTLDFDWQPQKIYISHNLFKYFSIKELISMPRQRAAPEQAKLNRQQRNERYRANLASTERNRERNKLYQQRKRQQARLQQHPDPFTQLAEIVIQQQHLDEGNDLIDESIVVRPVAREEKTMDVSGTVEENGEVLENFVYNIWNGGSDSDDNHSNGGFVDEIDLDINDGN